MPLPVRLAASAALLAWLVSMTSRQAGHFFFEPKGYDHINQATHEHKEDIKVGYNLRRKVVLMAAWALAFLGLASLLLLILTALGAIDRFAGAVVFLFAFGWLTGLGLAKLYKIVAFLTWLECYGSLLGKRPTPRVQDLVIERRAAKWFAAYFLSVWSGTVALLLDQPSMFRIAAFAMTVATLGIVRQLIRTRRLADVAGSLRPSGISAPHLLYASI